MDCNLKRLGNFLNFNYYVDENYHFLIICVLVSTEWLDTFRFEFQQYRELKQELFKRGTSTGDGHSWAVGLPKTFGQIASFRGK